MKFNGMILRDTREAFNMSRKDLGDALGISEQSVWQYENEMTTPKFNVINSLKRIFGVELNYFQKESNIPKIIQSSQIAYRSDLKKSVKNTQRETLYISIVDNFLNSLLENVSLPEANILELSNLAIKMKLNGRSLDEIAERIRNELNINSSNKNMMAAIEKSGVFIIERSLNKNIDAYSAWTEHNRPYIILGMNKYGPRRMFDLAHEFGHILLHRNMDFDSSDTSIEIRKIENEANEFASSFALPKNEFTLMFKENVNDPTNPLEYLRLKKHFQFSIASLEMRAVNLSLMSRKQSGIFWARMNKNNFKNVEPLDNEMTMYVPGKIYAIFNILTIKQLKQLYEKTGVSRKYIDSLIIPNVNERIPYIKQDIKTSNSNVISLKDKLNN